MKKQKGLMFFGQQPGYPLLHFVAVLRTNFYKILIPILVAVSGVAFVECV
jgi:hypothetical protein